MEVEVFREERPAGPLAVGILQGEQPRTEPFRRDAGPRARPHLRRGAHEVALHLPPQSRVGVKQPVEQGGVAGHC